MSMLVIDNKRGIISVTDAVLNWRQSDNEYRFRFIQVPTSKRARSLSCTIRN
ncbi:MAG TPA: hypothetical protein HA357_01495 [Candidatus Thalassarchaeaceae archaeon]|nr:hypothetical protein [Candidatus Thalassarchaeaceae archaeon]